jgi:acyl-CoA synthetase (AMP-forming)/AMP-acid ligase II
MIFHSPYPPVAIPELPFSEFIFANVAHWYDHPAFVDGPTGRTLTHGQMHRAARNVASALKQRRMRKGDVFAIVCPNVPEYGIAFHGAAIAGGVVTTANPLATVEELTSQFKDSQAKFVLTTETLVAKVREAAAGTYVEELFVLGESEDATPFAGLMDTDAPAPVVQIDPRADLLMLPYSSGTTGRSKGVMLTHYNAVAMLTQIESLAPDVTGRSSLAVLPFFHAYGLQILLNGTLRRGTTCVTIRDSISPSSCSSYKIGASPPWLLCRRSCWRWRSIRLSMSSTCLP